MNYILHLNSFFRLAPHDTRLRPCHISLYMALFQRWNEARFEQAFTIKREWVMHMSRIGSKATYHKCLKELHLAGYIVYHHAVHKYGPVKISMVTLPQKTPTGVRQPDLFAAGIKSGPPGNSHAGGSLLHDTCTNSSTAPVPEPGRAYIDTNKLKNSVNNSRGDHPSIPGSREVDAYFASKAYAAAEGQKFFLHYESTGWNTGRQTPIINWKAAADKWMLNIINRKTPSSNGNNTPHLHTQNDKNYSEPL